MNKFKKLFINLFGSPRFNAMRIIPCPSGEYAYRGMNFMPDTGSSKDITDAFMLDETTDIISEIVLNFGVVNKLVEEELNRTGRISDIYLFNYEVSPAGELLIDKAYISDFSN